MNKVFDPCAYSDRPSAMSMLEMARADLNVFGYEGEPDNIVFCTVISDRNQMWLKTLPSHLLMRRGKCRHVWVLNALPHAEQREIINLANSARGVRVLTINSYQQTIACAYNLALLHAAMWHDAGVFVELQDDVVPPLNLIDELLGSPLDMASARHIDAPPRYEFCGEEYLPGLCYAMKRKVFNAIGFHDECFESGVDTEYGIRARRERFSLGYVPNLIVEHLGKQSANGTGSPRQYEIAMNILNAFNDAGILCGRRDTKWRERERSDWRTWSRYERVNVEVSGNE